MCPRGSFYDLFLSRLSPKKAVPAVLRRRGVRVAVLSLLIGTLGGQLYLAWPEPEGMGLAMVRLLTMTTAVGLLAGVVVHHRLWCHICPVGTIGSWLSRGRRLHIRGECTNCGVCSKLCPMQLRPYRFSPGVMTDGDCIKCSMCVSACPRKALGFGDGFKEAA
jgi:polyferredoxin